MPYVNRTLRRVTGVLLLVVIIVGLAACATTTSESHHQNDVKAHQVLTGNIPENLAGCDEIDIDQQLRGDLDTNGAVDERAARAVVVYDNISTGSHIGLTGEDSCLWITGNVGHDVYISVSGDGSGVVVEGTINPSAFIEVSGADAITWLPKITTVGFAGEESPTLRIAGTGDEGVLIINGLTEIPH